MFQHSLPASRRFQPALTILESLVLLATSTMLALIAVPVLLVKNDIIKREQLPLITTPPANLPELKLSPLTQPALPKAPDLPPPASVPAIKDN